MAVATQAQATSAGRRRLLYGANTALNAVLAVVVAVLAVWAADRFNKQADWTTSGRNSLSPRTIKLLGNLEQPITITGLYAVISEYQQFAEKRRDMVADLLDLYEAAGGGQITAQLVDPLKEQAQLQALLARLKEKKGFADESKPHQAALEPVPQLIADLQKTASADFEQMQQLAKASDALNRNQNFVIVARNLQTAADTAETLQKNLEQLLKGDLPRYGQAVEVVREAAPQLQAILTDSSKWLSTNGAQIAGLSADAQQFFASAEQRYQPLLDQLAAFLASSQDLKRVKLEELYDMLSRAYTAPPIVVETDDSAEVLSFEDVWPMRTDQAPPSAEVDPREFRGEQAISSAILRLTQNERTAVIFVHFGGPSPVRPDFSNFNPMMQQLPRAPYGSLVEALEKENFIVEAWNVADQMAPPEVPDAKRRVYVVLTPQPPQQPNPMQPPTTPGISGPQKQAVLEAVDASGMAMFWAQWQPPAGPMAPTTPYAWGEYLARTWNIDVRDDQVTLMFAASPQDPNLWVLAGRQDPFIVTDEALTYTDHPVAEALRGLPIGLRMAAPVLVAPAASQPTSQAAGRRVEPLLVVTRSESTWAIADVQTVAQELRAQQGTKLHPETDRPSPFPVAVAGEQDGGKRVVVVGSEDFATDDVADASGLTIAGGALRAYRLFPGNIELVVNAVHWLTGNADRIAVGPRSSEIPRLDQLKDQETTNWIRVFLVAIWPAVALAAGGVVWLVRRR